MSSFVGFLRWLVNWLLEPVPTPELHKGPGFVILHEGAAPLLAPGIPTELIDLTQQKDDVAATWALFHRYLFEYRSELTLPLTLLIDAQSRARKVCSGVPAEATLTSDLARIEQSRSLALPFPGRVLSGQQDGAIVPGATAAVEAVAEGVCNGL